MKSKVAEKKPAKQRKTTEISKASEHVKAQKAKKPTRRRATKSKSIERT